MGDCFQIHTTELVLQPTKKDVILQPNNGVLLLLAPNANVTIIASGAESLNKTVTLGEDIDAFTVVVIMNGLAYKADTTVPLHSGYISGVLANGGISGSTVSLITDGSIENPAWSWSTNTGNRLWASTAGLMVEVPDYTHEFMQEIGTIDTATKITIDVQEPTIIDFTL